MRAVYHNVNFLFKFTSFVLGSKLTIYGLDHFMAFLFVRVQVICLRLFVKALSIAQDFLRRIQISKVNNVCETTQRFGVNKSFVMFKMFLRGLSI